MSCNLHISDEIIKKVQTIFGTNTIDIFSSNDFNVHFQEMALQPTICLEEGITIYQATYKGSKVEVKVVLIDEHTECFIRLLVDLTTMKCFSHENILNLCGAGVASLQVNSKIGSKVSYSI